MRFVKTAPIQSDSDLQPSCDTVSLMGAFSVFLPVLPLFYAFMLRMNRAVSLVLPYPVFRLRCIKPIPCKMTVTVPDPFSRHIPEVLAVFEPDMVPVCSGKAGIGFYREGIVPICCLRQNCCLAWLADACTGPVFKHRLICVLRDDRFRISLLLWRYICTFLPAPLMRFIFWF